MKSTKAIHLIIIGVIFTSCIGTSGPAGPEGQDGEDAELYSETITIDSDIDFAIDNEYVSVASYGWNILDEATVDEGIVLGYLRFKGQNSWYALPLTTPFENDNVVLGYSFDIDDFSLILEGEVANNNEANEELFDGDVLRIVAIPPTFAAKYKGLDYSNYEAVVKAYGLKFDD
tara:strand:+ start:2883 stop:3404 length:522 start_codon:yes stop_codon:yes gene_type:complete